MDKTYLTDYKTSLEKLDMTELRKKASQNFGLKLTREHTRDNIVDAILGEVARTNFAEQADGELKPGYARIVLSRTEGRSTLVYLNCNGYFCWIPVEIEVDVPIKVLEVLENAKEMKKVRNEFNEYVDVLSKSYPYNTIAICPGPDPKPGREAQTARKWAPYYAFCAQWGYWPSQKVLQAATSSHIAFNAFKAQLQEEEKE